MGTILVGTDTSAAAEHAVGDAARLARERGFELVILHVRARDDARAVVDPGRAANPVAYLAGLVARVRDVAVRSRIETGEPAERICHVAAEEGAEVIVIGNRGAHGSAWRVRDSVPNLVLRHAPCSVFIVDTRMSQ